MENKFLSKKSYYVMYKNAKTEKSELCEIDVDKIDTLAMLAISIKPDVVSNNRATDCYAKLIKYLEDSKSELKNIFEIINSTKEGKMFFLQTINLFLLEKEMRRNDFCKETAQEFINELEIYAYQLHYNNTTFLENAILPKR